MNSAIQVLKSECSFADVCYKTTIRPLFTFDSKKGTIEPSNEYLPSNVAICGDSLEFQLSLDDAVDQARKVRPILGLKFFLVLKLRLLTSIIIRCLNVFVQGKTLCQSPRMLMPKRCF